MSNRIGAVLLAIVFASACGKEEPRRLRNAGEVTGGTALTAEAVEGRRFAYGQTVYVPVYSHVLPRQGDQALPLATNLSVRNTDTDHSLVVLKALYFDSEGKLVREFLKEPRELAPLSTLTLVVGKRDDTGGVGANFLIRWRSESKLSQPLIEAVNIGTHGTMGLSFVSPSRVIEEYEGD